MDLIDRIYELHRILRAARRPVPRTVLTERLECSRATLTRLISRMRDFLGAPIEYDRRAHGYRYASGEEGPYELPGLWFSASELYALLTAEELLANAQPGLLEEVLAPLRARIEELLEARHLQKGQIGRRIRVLRMAARRHEPVNFRTAAEALLRRRRLRIVYHSRSRDEITERELSPQRLVYYRDNWYLDAWDHTRRGLRSFAVDRIERARVLHDTQAKDVSDERLDRYFASSYGIFAGRPKHKAVLRFSAERARWVADEVWHPRQRSWYDGGYYYLEIPYSDPRELMLDVLKYGPDVQVLAPPALRREVARRLQAAAGQYATKPPPKSARPAGRRPTAAPLVSTTLHGRGAR